MIARRRAHSCCYRYWIGCIAAEQERSPRGAHGPPNPPRKKRGYLPMNHALSATSAAESDWLDTDTERKQSCTFKVTNIVKRRHQKHIIFICTGVGYSQNSYFWSELSPDSALQLTTLPQPPSGMGMGHPPWSWFLSAFSVLLSAPSALRRKKILAPPLRQSEMRHAMRENVIYSTIWAADAEVGHQLLQAMTNTDRCSRWRAPTYSCRPSWPSWRFRTDVSRARLCRRPSCWKRSPERSRRRWPGDVLCRSRPASEPAKKSHIIRRDFHPIEKTGVHRCQNEQKLIDQDPQSATILGEP